MEQKVERAALRRSVALAAHEFPDWEAPSDTKRDFGAGEIVGLLTALATALVVIDKHMKAADAVIERLRRIYKWVRTVRGKAADPSPPALSERERLLALLFDEYIGTRSPIGEARLAALSGIDTPVCHEHLQDLAILGLVLSCPSDSWMFRT